MARKIIVLGQLGLPSDLTYSVAFWLTVPTARQPFVARATATSVVVGITGPELAAIQAGQIIEQIVSVPYAVGTLIATITADLVTRYNAAQAISDSINPWNRYGSFWDGTTWTSITVA